jgi:dihydrofolate reductase
MNLTIIAAISENNVIGNEGTIPWKIPEDMKRFKRLTMSCPIIMGRKTYESIPPEFRPLTGRKNIVLSTSLQNEDGIYVARTLEEALNFTEDKDSYVIGGKQIYETFMPMSNKLEITRVHVSCKGDAYFPEIYWSEWAEIKREGGVSSKSNIAYSFLTYIRRKVA